MSLDTRLHGLPSSRHPAVVVVATADELRSLHSRRRPEDRPVNVNVDA